MISNKNTYSNSFIKSSSNQSQIRALLGPTNTGKTHYAMDRMLAHNSGMIGFPLRLLARENYDKAVLLVGKSRVALITGEEKIIPPGARYFCCTVEAMPIERSVSFMSIDEIQLAGDRERGHVFTDRILNARGSEETIFLGSETIRPLLQKILPNCSIEIRPRLSTLSYIGVKKITKLKPRSAIVAFSIPEVYRIAELVRTQKGGAAIVMGALSPRTRNSQIELYQNGQVDYLIATDAIGMGLNMNIDHVAFASDIKFDGSIPRHLTAAEIAQIAGRAGRHSKNGSFGVVDDSLKFEEDTIDQIESHLFPPLRDIWWRNSLLDFTSMNNLIKSLDVSAPYNFMRKKADALDTLSLSNLSKLNFIKKEVNNQEILRLLWDVCQIPDFSNSLSGVHFNLLEKTFELLLKGKLDNDWINSQLKRLNRFDGEIDTLLNRISNIRTWTFITNRKHWTNDPEYWQDQAKGIEDKLSDELHDRLTQRFVDKRIVILTKKLKEQNNLEAIVKLDGTVFVEGEQVGTLNGFDFVPTLSEGENATLILSAARKTLPKEIERRVRELLMSDDAAFKLNADGSISWQNNNIAKFTAGENIYSPKTIIKNYELLSVDHIKQIELRVIEAVEKNIKKTLFESFNLENPSKSNVFKSPINKSINDTINDEVVNHDKDAKVASSEKNVELNLSGKAIGISYQVYEGMGSVATKNLSMSVQNLDEPDKRSLAKLGLRLGIETIYLPNLLKPVAINLRGLLWSIYNSNFPETGVPPEGRVGIVMDVDVPHEYYRAIGFVPLGKLALRADIAERISALIRTEARLGRFKINEAMLSIAGSTKTQMEDVLYDLGYIKVDEEPSTLVDQIPIAIFERKKKIIKIKNEHQKINQNKKIKVINKEIKNSFKEKKKEVLPDPLSPFAVLKSLKVK